MQDLLFLTHRIPFPPNKGDKIRSYHLLKHLAKRYRVHLGTFIDDPNDWQYTDAVNRMCGDTCYLNLNPGMAKLQSLKALACNQAMTLDYYRNNKLQNWVDQIVKKYEIRHVLVFSSAMAQYANKLQHARRIIDFVDIDSDKWAQYAQKKYWPMNWLYQRESRVLLSYEKKVAREFDASLFVSKAEAKLFTQLAPESTGKIGYFSNGVDTVFFSTEHDYPNPYKNGEIAIVFTGAMDYWPNVDAVQWFSQEIFPSVVNRHPKAHFYIVGSRPSAQVMALAELPGVHVTGSVPDVRPYIAHAQISVAPLRIARGIQNKVLEAMSMEKSVIVTPQALEGIDAVPGEELIVAENSEQFIAEVSRLIAMPQNTLGKNSRIKILSRYGWDSNLACVDALLDLTLSAKETL